MSDKRAVLRIREGAFVYLLATDRAVSIKGRNSTTFETLGDPRSMQVAWFLSGNDRVPIYRLGLLFEDQVEEWGHAIILDDGDKRIGIAAEQVNLTPEYDNPTSQPFNPAGLRHPMGRVIIGVCPDTEPEYLVLDAARLYECLLRGEVA